MRVVAGGLFVFLGMLVSFALLRSVLPAAPPWLMGGGVSLVMLGLAAVSLWLFNPKGTDPFGRRSLEEQLRELRRLDLLEASSFRAKRAFGVEEYEDEGLHCYIELESGSVLFLSGQYLYDYEPITDDPELNQPRRFPCSEFTVHRHRQERFVADITCGGSVLEPEGIAPPLGARVWRAGGVPEDGQVITTATFEELKERDSKRAVEQGVESNQRLVTLELRSLTPVFDKLSG